MNKLLNIILGLVFFNFLAGVYCVPPLLTGISDSTNPFKVCTIGNFQLGLYGVGFANNPAATCLYTSFPAGVNASTPVTFINSTNVQCLVPDRVASGLSVNVILYITNDGVEYSNGYEIKYSGSYAWKGNVFLTGHDPDFHALKGFGNGAPFFEKSLDFVTNYSWRDLSVPNRKKFLFIESKMAATGTDVKHSLDTFIYYNLTVGVHFDHVDYSEFANAALSDYCALVVASAGGGMLTTWELRALNARKSDITYFLKQGGGLAAYAEGIGSFTVTKNLAGITNANVSEAFGFLPITVEGSPNILQPYKPTQYGIDHFNITVLEINDPSHSIFSQTGGLNILTYDAKNAIVTLAGQINPCPDDCNGNGVCTCGQCTCENGYHGNYCECDPSVDECPGVCGDGILNGDELCDGGIGCLANCTGCIEGYVLTEPLSLSCSELQIPRITNVTSAPTQGGIVTMIGTKLGVDAGAIVVLIGNNQCTSVAFIDSAKTTFTCTAAPGAGVGLPIQITAAGREGDGKDQPLFSYLPPTFTSSNSIYTNGGSISIFGTNFGQEPSLLTVTIDNKPCPVTQAGHSYLVCTVNPGCGTNKAVSIDVFTQTTTGTFSYKPPAITSTTDVKTEGSQITLIGTSLGTASSSRIIYYSPDYQCDNVISVVDHTIVACDVVSGTGADYNIWINVCDQISNNDTFSYGKPTITNKLNSVSTKGGDVITLSGSNYGNNVSLISVDIGGTPCTDIVLTEAHSELTCVTPAGTGVQSITITVDGQTSAIDKIGRISASIDSFSSVTTEGGDVTISGSNFGDSQSQSTVTIGGSDCPILSLSDTEIVCTIGAGSGLLDITININGIESSFPSGFSYAKPTITSTTSADTAGGQIITIDGESFGTDPYDITLLIDSNLCDSVSITIPHKQFTCVAPSGTGTQYLGLIVNQLSTESTFTYNAPTFTSNTKVSTGGAVQTTITGNNFGTDPSLVLVTINNKYCSSISISVPDTELVCTAPANTGSKAIQITVDSLSGSGLFTYQSPAVSESTITSTAGGIITIQGQNFGSDDSVISVLANNQPCKPIKVLQPQTTIQCMAGVGQGVNNPIVVSVDGLVSDSASVLSYQIPAPSSASGQVTFESAGNVTITGDNFGSIQSEVSVEIDGQPCAPVTILVDHSQIQCTLQPGTGFGLNVNVTVSGQSSLPNTLFDFDDGARCDDPTCSGNGVCVGGVCSCYSPYIGRDCSDVNLGETPSTGGSGGDASSGAEQPPIVTPDPDLPNIVITLPTNETIFIFVKEVREVDSVSSDIVKSYMVSEMKWDQVTNSSDESLQWTYTLTLPDNSSFVTTTVTYFLKNATVNFANQDIAMPSGNIKFNIDIDGWQYQSAINSIKVIMTAHVVGNPNNCNEDQVQLDQNSDETQLHWFEFNQNGHSLYGRFSNRAYTDGRIVPVKQAVERRSADGREIDVSISVPHFDNSTNIDPDFSILMRTTSTPVVTECGTVQKSTNWRPIVGGVVGGVGAAGMLIAGTLFLRRKREENKFKSSLGNIGKNA